MILVSPLLSYSCSSPASPAYCHMVSDRSHTELHDFAAAIGLKRHWFKGDHYQLFEADRDKAVARGAEDVLVDEMLERMALRLSPETRELAKNRGRF